MNRSNLTKNLIFSLFFILIVSILILGLVFPQLKTYKKLLIAKQNQEKINNEYNTQKNILNDKLQTFIADNEKMLKMYKADFNENDFYNFCLKYFNNASLDFEKISEEEKYLKYTLKVSTNINSPTNFYDFVKALEDYTSIIKVEFPISLKASKNEIEAVFNIKIYKD